MSDYDSATYAAVAAGLGVYTIIVLAVVAVILVAWWKLFVKAGKPGWAAIVPIYNTYCLFDISFGNGWLFLLCLVPCVNAVMLIILWIKLAKAFGKGIGFGIGTLFFPYIFLLILAFGDAEYVGPA